MVKNNLNPSGNFLAEIRKTRISDLKMTQKYPESGQNTPQKSFWWFKNISWYVSRRILDLETAKNVQDSFKKNFSWNLENSDFSPKVTQNWPKNILKVVKTPPKMLLMGRKRFLERF